MNDSRRWIGIALSIPLLMLAALMAIQAGFSAPIAQAQAGSGITVPEPGATVSGAVTVTGTATDPNFQRYELYFKPADADESAYAFFASGEAEVVNGPLGVWETGDLAPGLYTLRMRVVRTDGNYTEYFVREIEVADEAGEPVEEPTVAVTATAAVTPTETVTETATPEPAEEEAPPPATEDEAEEAEIPAAEPQILATRAINVRGGPGTDYAIVGATTADQRYRVVGVNPAGDWWQIELEDGITGWVLGSLVTAENIEDVPVVTDLPPTPEAQTTATPVPAATPTAEAVEEEEEAVTEAAEAVVVEEAVAIAEPIGLGPTEPMTITLVGAEDADAVQIFLRSILAAYGPNTRALTATVGTLPADLPLDLTVPATATVVGGVVRSGEFAGSQIFLSTDEEGEALLDAVREQLLAGDFTTPPADAFGGPDQVFLPSERRMPALLCDTDNQRIANLSSFSVANAADVMSIAISSYDRGGSPCEAREQPVDTAYAALPQLAPPADATVRPSGGSRGGNFVSAEATIIATMTATELAEHYEAQLQVEGWDRLEQSAADAIAWSAWTFTDDEGDEWNSTFYIVRQAGDTDTYLATIRANRQQ